MAFLVLLLAYLAVAVYHSYKPLPPGISVAMPLRAVDEVRFLADYTYIDEQGERRSEQMIFDEILRLIAQAEQLIVLDMFLINDFAGDARHSLRPLSREITDALIRRRAEVPGLEVVLITDPFNTLYNGVASSHLERLEAAGVKVVLTDLTRLRDSNPSWSALWRIFFRWLGNSPDGGWLPSPVGPEKVGLRTYLTLLNFNANHRKTFIADEGDGWVGLVTSGNPHDASSAHDNVALRFSGAAALDLLQTERAVSHFSGNAFPASPEAPSTESLPQRGMRLQILTESRIRQASLQAINGAQPGDAIDIAVFYLSHREIVEALKAAQSSGVALRLLLDPNEDAFGRKKNGIPNRQVALELTEAGVPVRWCDTHGEQCHSKFLMLRRAGGEAELILGSANFTRRNLDDYNLETNVRLLASGESQVMQQAAGWFEEYWHNRSGRRLSVDYEKYRDPSRRRYWFYRFMEASGWSTF
ncbi:MAG: phospholipase D family protein [Gammaproteobacteria bacterium]|nr:phospholipase D family protein [Gammaproteobacteria bacterium]MCW8973849.1 phospholipase D family protein [Gammaproteobacteria bacterium]MCW8992749.1 phospholipase D family protein [Gammaproteobacteria bacterium]